MSGKLGLIPYPQMDPGGTLETNPLTKYHNQLEPLGNITTSLFQTPKPPIQPGQSPMAQTHLRELEHRTAPPSQSLNPSQLLTPSTGAPPPLPPQQPPMGQMPGPGGPPGSATMSAAAPAMAPAAAPMPAVGSAMLSGAAANDTGEPHELTQYAQHPETGGLVRQRGAVARRLAAQTMGGPTFGSSALAQAGQERLAPEDAQGAIAPPVSATPITPEMSESHNRISTRIPSEPAQKKAGIDAHATADLAIDYDSMKRATDQKTKNAGLIKKLYPGFEHLRTDDPDKINEAFIKHATDNLKWLYNKMNDEKGPIGPGIVERAKRWYSGANKIAHDMAKEFGVKPYQAAAVLAALSPQKDWYQNVHLARRVFEAHQLGHNWRMTPEMQKYSTGYIKSLEKEGEEDPKKIGELRALQQKFQNTPMSELTDPHERAVFARWHDEAHNTRDYKMVTPEGELAGPSMIAAKYFTKGKKAGQIREEARTRNVSWGSFNEIAKGMAALQNASLPEVSRLMGGNHKVRNFFNNIIAPLHGHDVTIDTHAIAAALLRPLGGSAMEVGHGLGTSAGKGVPGAANAATLGNRGMYGLYAEAYRRAAKDLGIMPRELQSVTWEGVRGLFSPEQKRDEGFVKHIDNIWRNRGAFRGLTPDERREAIVAHAGGIKPPSWAGGVDHGDDD